MAKATLGVLLKEARAGAGLTQEQLAKKVPGVTAADISKAERDAAPLTQDVLKQIAKVTNVTQKSLLDASRTTKYASSAKTSGTSAAKKTSSTKPSASGTAKKPSTAKTSDQGVRLTAAEKKMLTLYRKADVVKREIVIKILESETDNSGVLGSILNSKTGGDTLSMLLNGAKELLGK
ncbi:MAG: helix-turn-helix domain-containing protein [Eubacteriales bacterium]|nr:helix-turn-helix domain-containing protein [Eubacteriales bacterium]